MEHETHIALFCSEAKIHNSTVMQPDTMVAHKRKKKKKKVPMTAVNCTCHFIVPVHISKNRSTCDRWSHSEFSLGMGNSTKLENRKKKEKRRKETKH